MHGAAALATAYLRVSDRAGIVVLGGALRWLGPAQAMRQFYRIAEMMLQARYDSFVTPDVGRIPRTALPPGTLVVAFSPLLDPRGFGAVTDLRAARVPADRGGHPQTSRAARPAPGRARRSPAFRASPARRPCAAAMAPGPRGYPCGAAGPRRPGAALGPGAELDGVLAPLRQPPRGIPAGAT